MRIVRAVRFFAQIDPKREAIPRVGESVQLLAYQILRLYCLGMKTRIVIGGEHIDVPADLANAILAGLTNQPTIEPPTTADSFDELISVTSATTRLISHLKDFRELAMAKADSTSPFANRRAVGIAAGMSPSQVLRIMERNGRPSSRKAIAEASKSLKDFAEAFNKPIPRKKRDTEK